MITREAILKVVRFGQTERVDDRWHQLELEDYHQTQSTAVEHAHMPDSPRRYTYHLRLTGSLVAPDAMPRADIERAVAAEIQYLLYGEFAGRLEHLANCAKHRTREEMVEAITDLLAWIRH